MCHEQPLWSRRRWTSVAVAGVLLGAGAAVSAWPGGIRDQAPGALYDAYRLACAPRAVRGGAPDGLAHVQSSINPLQGTYGPGDTLMVDAGNNRGLTVGQLFYVRRVSRPLEPGAEKDPWLEIRTAGWIRLTEVNDASALAAVVYGCDAFAQGDYLEPFELPTVPSPLSPPGQPDYAAPGRVLFGVDRRMAMGEHNFVVIDRGSNHGVKPGQHVTFFRYVGQDTEPRTTTALGTVMLVLTESATVRIDKMLQAVYANSPVALHR